MVNVKWRSVLSAGLMISGYARAAMILDDATYLDRAVRAAQFIRSHLYKLETGVLIRNGYRDDSGYVVCVSAVGVVT